MRFEDDGPTGAALLHDALSRLRRRLGAEPAAEPVGAHRAAGRRALLLADRHRPAAHPPRRLRARHRGGPQHRDPRAGRRRAARRMRALVQRVSRARRSTVAGERGGRDRPGAARAAGRHPRRHRRRGADWLADKVRALRVFADADGRMNEPLGDREVLCVSQFTLYGDARRGNRPSYVGGRAARARRAALRALLRAHRRPARRVRRAHGGRAGQRRPGDAAAGDPIIGGVSERRPDRIYTGVGFNPR